MESITNIKLLEFSKNHFKKNYPLSVKAINEIIKKNCKDKWLNNRDPKTYEIHSTYYKKLNRWQTYCYFYTKTSSKFFDDIGQLLLIDFLKSEKKFDDFFVVVKEIEEKEKELFIDKLKQGGRVEHPFYKVIDDTIRFLVLPKKNIKKQLEEIDEQQRLANDYPCDRGS